METQPVTLNEPDFNYSGLYTYADYLRWTIEERVELIRGKIFKMSPAPRYGHQELSGNIYGPMRNFLLQHPCQVMIAPFDVCFPRKSKKDEDITTILQPDICVICDPDKISDRGTCMGAPDLIVEVLSPGNSKKEMKLKYEVYEESGVREYWIIDPERKVCHVYFLEENLFVSRRPLIEGDVLKSRVLSGFELPVDDVFFQKFPGKY